MNEYTAQELMMNDDREPADITENFPPDEPVFDPELDQSEAYQTVPPNEFD